MYTAGTMDSWLDGSLSVSNILSKVEEGLNSVDNLAAEQLQQRSVAYPGLAACCDQYLPSWVDRRYPMSSNSRGTRRVCSVLSSLCCVGTSLGVGPHAHHPFHSRPNGAEAGQSS